MKMDEREKKSGLAGSSIRLAVTAAVLAVISAGTVFYVKQGRSTGAAGQTAGQNVEQIAGQTSGQTTENTVDVKAGGALEIPTSDITEQASFYKVKVDGTEEEVIAVRDSNGNVRTAFNTCQVCYGSGRGYYEQEGDSLVCQNCGNRFSRDQVEREAGGCNPWPIFQENRSEDKDTISIPYAYLSEAKAIFSNWKK